MKGNIIIGMIAGTMIGAVAAMIAMPYISPADQQTDESWQKK